MNQDQSSLFKGLYGMALDRINVNTNQAQMGAPPLVALGPANPALGLAPANEEVQPPLAPVAEHGPAHPAAAAMN
ncbi:hypothetical protein FRC12_001856 [Ceratobasidium sp. 428]|nr:hypothetical protein FRC12_001856 [Ceratobasidium sp. 428]